MSVHRPGTVAVNASLVFGGQAPGPSARDVLWTLYRKVKAAGQMLGNLSLDGSSLASDGESLPRLPPHPPQCLFPHPRGRLGVLLEGPSSGPTMRRGVVGEEAPEPS